MRNLFHILSATILLLLAIFLSTFHACKKEKIIVQGSRTDTIYIQYEHCQYDTSLPINCYTTHLRSGAQPLRSNGVDTLELNVFQYVTLGYCRLEKFVPLYILHPEMITNWRIPDTAMCRAAGIPLCCPGYNTDKPCLQATESAETIPYNYINDVSSVWFTLVDFCTRRDTLQFSFNLVGQTQYIAHPDSNPNLSCSQYLQALFQSSCEVFSFKNCTIRLIDIPEQYEPDTVTVVYLPQGENYYTTPCCAPAFKSTTGGFLDKTVKIELRCD